jgi:DNA modification methylase
MSIQLDTIYAEDCLQTMSRMPDESIDFVLTSPPYDQVRKYKGYQFDFKSIAQNLYRIIKVGGVVVWVVGDATQKGSETGTSFRQALYFKDIGFNLHDTMIYAKKNPIPLTHNRYEQQFEYMFVLTKGKLKTFNPIMRDNAYAGAKRTSTFRNLAKSEQPENANKSGYKNNQSIQFNIWFYSLGSTSSSKDKIAFQHPAIFPEALAQDHILSWSNESDVVYDPFMGSGTTAKMAKANNRHFIGSEISQEYVDIANARLEQVQVKA